MRQFESTFNPDATEFLERFEQRRTILLNQANIELFSGMVIKEELTTLD
jgi:hypothetical protein